MSYIDRSALRGVLDPTISFYTVTIAFTTGILNIDAKTLYRGFIKAFKISNQDVTNSLTFKQGQNTEPAKTLPPNSELSTNAWESYLQITPSASTGTGYVELDIVPIESAVVNPQQYQSGMV